jgi:arylsulfatase A-like enzyme
MPRPPNILIVMTDHQRGDTVLPEHGCLTPNVERLAREGVTFTETFCPSPHCCPARATFFTGQYPSVHGVWNNVCNGQRLSAGVHPEVRMWSQDLRAAGYDLHFTGKWHVSTLEDPKDRGWTEHGPCSNKGTLHGQRWDHWQTLAGQPDPTTRGPGQILRPGWGPYTMYGVNESFPHDEAATQHALDTLAGLKGSDRPWCLYVGLIGPHDPYLAPQRYLDRYRVEDIPLPRSYLEDRMRDKPGLYQRMRDQIWGQITAAEVRDGIRHFWAYCSFLDELFGRILDGLDATGQAENTFVLYTSDHGDYCGEHGLFCKSIPCFRGAYHVPAVARWPRGIRQPGRGRAGGAARSSRSSRASACT